MNRKEIWGRKLAEQYKAEEEAWKEEAAAKKLQKENAKKQKEAKKKQEGKGPWTEEEDKKVIELVERHGPKWSKIASELQGECTSSLKCLLCHFAHISCTSLGSALHSYLHPP